jgi:hypothetical protein
MNDTMSADKYQKLINGNKKKSRVVRYNSASGTVTEGEIQNQILDWLNLKQIFNWRQNTMGVYCGKDNQGNARFRKAPTTGVSDILGVLPNGRFLAIECKRPGGKATPEQMEFIDSVNSNGGLAFVADNLDVVMEMIDDKK